MKHSDSFPFKNVRSFFDVRRGNRLTSVTAVVTRRRMEKIPHAKRPDRGAHPVRGSLEATWECTIIKKTDDDRCYAVIFSERCVPTRCSIVSAGGKY